jgi:NAD(P)-dependent dehydrogenase (short-subunit alcohol dehydrogenase family)
MGDKKVWLVTGAGRGMGVDIARAALAAGHAVVATGRNTEKVSSAIGEHDDLLAVKLDVTDPADAEAAVAAVVDRFGRIDVLVNNAGNFNAGFFEELSSEEFGHRSRPPSSVRSTSLVRPFRSCAGSGPGWWSRSPRPPASRADCS